VWYNRQRRHAALGYANPEAFDVRYFESSSVSGNWGLALFAITRRNVSVLFGSVEVGYGKVILTGARSKRC
jgi:hypothetical protein